VASSFEDALFKAESYIHKTNGQIFVIGGSSIYNSALNNSNCCGIFLTEITGPMKDGDVFLPINEIKARFKFSSISGIGYELIHESCKNIIFEEPHIIEKKYKYQFNFYHKLK
jgi:dihydrofolate reductase